MRAQLTSAIVGLPAAALLVTAVALGNDEVRFGATDVPTVFYISKSDDRNRVDYGMRLSEGCAPLGSESVFPYWRDFEKSPPVRTHALGTFEYFGYGISEQRMVRGGKPDAAYLVRLRQFKQRPVWITTSRDESGRCRVRVRCSIGAVRFAELSSIYLKLAGPMSVEYIIIKGRDPSNGNLVEEKIMR